MAMSEQEVKALVGKTVNEAQKLVTDKGMYVTIMSEDGRSFPVLTMIDPNRICFHVEQGKVTGATNG
jgi:hypothetical protein